MRNFFKGTPRNPKPEKEVLIVPQWQKVLKKVLFWGKLILFIIAFIAACYGIWSFFDNYSLRSPFQNPIVPRQSGIISPLGKSLVHNADASLAGEASNPFDPKSPKGIAWEINKEKFGVENWEALEKLIQKESGWNPYAVNKSSGACGLGQSLPCQKMACEQWDYDCQVKWIADYIQNRYKTPNKALAFHFEKGWY